MLTTKISPLPSYHSHLNNLTAQCLTLLSGTVSEAFRSGGQWPKKQTELGSGRVGQVRGQGPNVCRACGSGRRMGRACVPQGSYIPQLQSGGASQGCGPRVTLSSNFGEDHKKFGIIMCNRMIFKCAQIIQVF